MKPSELNDENRMKMTSTKTFGFQNLTSKASFGRLNIYRIGDRGFAYNPSLREWELYDMDSDGSIQDLRDRVKTRAEAELWARG